MFLIVPIFTDVQGSLNPLHRSLAAYNVRLRRLYATSRDLRLDLLCFKVMNQVKKEWLKRNFQFPGTSSLAMNRSITPTLTL